MIFPVHETQVTIQLRPVNVVPFGGHVRSDAGCCEVVRLSFVDQWPLRSDTYWKKCRSKCIVSDLVNMILQRQKRKKRFPRCTSKMAKEHFQDVDFFWAI